MSFNYVESGWVALSRCPLLVGPLGEHRVWFLALALGNALVLSSTALMLAFVALDRFSSCLLQLPVLVLISYSCNK